MVEDKRYQALGFRRQAKFDAQSSALITYLLTPEPGTSEP
jgi:hypothetical protein